MLRITQAVVYAALGVAAVRTWRRARTRPALYLALAFLALAVVITLARVSARTGLDDVPWLSDASVALVLAFPWLLAAFAWSFEDPRPPRWLQLAGAVQLALAVVVFFLPPLGTAGQRPREAMVFVLLVVILWLLLVVAASTRLWHAAPDPGAIRTRTRAMAVAAFTLGVVLAVSATVPDTGALTTAEVLITIVAGVLFGLGFAPPRMLRWHQLPAEQVSRLQTALIGAATPKSVAAAIVPTIAAMYGAGTVFLDRDGAVLAATGVGTGGADELVVRALSVPEHPRVRVTDIEGFRLIIETSPYAPVFGASEEDLLAQFRLQLRLALQRALLFAANEAAREELQQAYDDQQEMLIGLAHDLRGPVVTISSYSGLLEDAADVEEARSFGSDIRVSAAYLDRLVDGISELSRIGRRDGASERIGLDEVVSRTAERLSAPHPGLRVVVEGPLPALIADRLRVEQVIDNLLSNAARHGGREDVTVRLHAEPSDGGVRLVVQDDGRGIPTSEHDVVFGLFRRGSASDQSGSGVGLGLVRRIVGSIGGHVRLVPSTTGARFELDFPADVVDSSAPVDDDATAASTTSPGRR